MTVDTALMWTAAVILAAVAATITLYVAIIAHAFTADLIDRRRRRGLTPTQIRRLRAIATRMRNRNQDRGQDRTAYTRIWHHLGTRRNPTREG